MAKKIPIPTGAIDGLAKTSPLALRPAISIPTGAIDGMAAGGAAAVGVGFQYQQVRLTVGLNLQYTAINQNFNTNRCD